MPNTPQSLIDPAVTHTTVRQFAEDKVNLPSETAKKRREKVNDLRERLANYLKEHPDCGIVKSYQSGSLRKGTALKTGSDVDVAVYIKSNGDMRVNRELLEWIAERLRKAYPTMKPEQIQPKTYSVGIEYRDAGIEIDVVPVFCDKAEDTSGYLVSQDDGSLLMTDIPRHMEFIRTRKDRQPTHFAQAVRLVKWWVREQKLLRGEAFRFKSFMVELIFAHLADSGQDLSDYPVSMQAFFNYIVDTGLRERIAFTDYYAASKLPTNCTDPVQIFDPVNPDNNVAALYTEQNRRLIVEAAQDALDALNEAHMSATKGEAVAMWQVVLGKSFRG
ncbi:hypothetical protein AY599_07795 [Leptolyngbya valderiana BDU 20041]|nr:hypothetical protein AY599_07795 [Leptolyngbya valderiana BDU 20041]